MPAFTPEVLAEVIGSYDDDPSTDYVLVLWDDGGISVEPPGDYRGEAGWIVRLSVIGGEGRMGPVAARDPRVINNLYADLRVCAEDWGLRAKGLGVYYDWLWEKFLRPSVPHPLDPPPLS